MERIIPAMTDTSEKARSQCEAILRHLQAHGSIEMKAARERFGCEALRSRIADLRKRGFQIETKMQAFMSRFGHPGRYAVYYLKKAEK